MRREATPQLKGPRCTCGAVGKYSWAAHAIHCPRATMCDHPEVVDELMQSFYPPDAVFECANGCGTMFQLVPVNAHDRLARMAAAGEELVRGVAWWLDATPARSSVQERKDALRAVRQAIANFEEASRE